MLCSSAAKRGVSQMTIDEWRQAYGSLGGLLPLRNGIPVLVTDAGGVPTERIGDDHVGQPTGLAAQASAAATVVLPTPPWPATMARRVVLSSSPGPRSVPRPMHCVVAQ
jgi:hypothetical protein